MAAFSGRGSTARNWREALHVLHTGYEAIKGLGEALMPDDDDKDR